MNKEYQSKIELITNILIIVVALLFGSFLIQQIVFSNQQIQTKELKKGDKISLSNVDWKNNKKTFLLFLKKDCMYCTESIPFYKILAKKAIEENVTLIVFSLDSLVETKKYLEDHDLNFPKVRQIVLEDINVRGTPTLIQANEKGEVSKIWLGKLSPEKEKEVMNQL